MLYVNQFGKETKLPSALRRRLRKVLEYNSNKVGFNIEQQREIFEELPLKLKCEIAMIMHHGAIKSMSFFHNKDPTFIVDFVILLKPLQVQQSEVLWNEGDPPSEVYFIINGKVDFLMQDVVF